MKKLNQIDPQISKLIKLEEKRQTQNLQMIPSENHTSKAVMEAVGSVLCNKYSEGFVGKRYYQGNQFIDEVEALACDRAKKLFKVPYVNVQPYSGSPANSEVFFALLNPGDKVLGMAVSAGGHLTHGHPNVTISGKFFTSIQYGLNPKGLIDYDELERLALEHKPKLIVSGTSAYSRIIDYKRIWQISEKVGAYHLCDIAHVAGLIAGGSHPSPVKFSHIITTTTHKTLRGPRGAMIMVTDLGLKKDPELSAKIEKAVFPGMQGGPHNNTTAGIAVALKEASTKSFEKYAGQIVTNAKVLATELTARGFSIVSGGTDNHLMLIDITTKGLDGWCAAWALEYAGIVVNRNAIPFDKRSAFYPSGIRLGTPGITTRGMKEAQMKKIAKWIDLVVNRAATLVPADVENADKAVSRAARAKFKQIAQKDKVILEVAKEVRELCKRFPV